MWGFIFSVLIMFLVFFKYRVCIRIKIIILIKMYYLLCKKMWLESIVFDISFLILIRLNYLLF